MRKEGIQTRKRKPKQSSNTLSSVLGSNGPMSGNGGGAGSVDHHPMIKREFMGLGGGDNGGLGGQQSHLSLGYGGGAHMNSATVGGMMTSGAGANKHAGFGHPPHHSQSAAAAAAAAVAAAVAAENSVKLCT